MFVPPSPPLVVLQYWPDVIFSLSSLYEDDPQAYRRGNHNMVEYGVHIVPTLRNHVVIFLNIKF